MRQFIKYTIATVVGCSICIAGIIILASVVITGIIVANTSSTVEVKDNSVLYVNLSGDIVEHATENPFESIMGSGGLQQGLDNIVGAIDKAADSKEIKAIYIEAGITNTDYPSLQEIRQALQRAKAKKKLVVSYAREYTQGAYYVCSVADKVWINPEGMLDLHGLSSQPMFLKDLYAKFGVKMTVVKVGKFKSATEQYTEDKMSDANRLQVTRFLDGIWENVVSDISKARKISKAEVNRCADDMAALQSTEYLLRHKLVDKTLYAEEVKTEMKKLIGIAKDKSIEQVSCSELNSSELGRKDSEKKIAIYYCEGSIVRAPEAGIITGDAGIVSTTVVKDMEKLANDDDIKAVVIRINSGGGDAFASEEIWHAIKTLKGKKPVVVSMGGMAASGAYYMSCVSSYIMAQPTTLTGSIGIFGVFPDASELITKKLGVKFDNVKTNAHSDFSFLQTARPFNTEEQALLQAYINRGYELFCKRVADGRRLPVNKVKEIAEGRVWLATDAKEIGLIDGIGGINDAIAKAAQLAKVKDYETVAYPEAAGWMEQLTAAAEGYGNNLDEQLRSSLGVMYEPMMMMRNLDKLCPVQARCPVILSVK